MFKNMKNGIWITSTDRESNYIEVFNEREVGMDEGHEERTM